MAQETEVYIPRYLRNIITVIVILGSQTVYVTGLFRPYGNVIDAAPENKNLDPNDLSPGTLFLPNHYQTYKAPLPARVQPWDMTDDQINVREVYYRNNPDYFLWHNPPCEWFNEGSDSSKNIGRLVGCGHILRRLKKDQKKEEIKGAPPSTKCSNIIDFRCFRFRGYRGRCYMMVQTISPNATTYKYVLINSCD